MNLKIKTSESSKKNSLKIAFLLSSPIYIRTMIICLCACMLMCNTFIPAIERTVQYCSEYAVMCAR